MMEKKPSEQAKKPSKFNKVLINLPHDEFQALRKLCYERNLKHGPFIREMLAERLRQESYLKKEARKP